MKRQKQTPIMVTAQQLLLEMENAVKRFPRFHKYTLGRELRNNAPSKIR